VVTSKSRGPGLDGAATRTSPVAWHARAVQMFQVMVLGLHSAANALNRSCGVAGTSLGGSETVSLKVAFVIVRPAICDGGLILKAVPAPNVPYSLDCHPTAIMPPYAAVSLALGSLVAVVTRLSVEAYTVRLVGAGVGGRRRAAAAGYAGKSDHERDDRPVSH